MRAAKGIATRFRRRCGHAGNEKVGFFNRSGPAVLSAKAAGLAQLAEQLICNQQVEGSSPLAGFYYENRIIHGFLEGCPSGQRGRAVNPLRKRFEGSIPSPSTSNYFRFTPLFGLRW